VGGNTSAPGVLLEVSMLDARWRQPLKAMLAWLEEQPVLR
jgi:hypothetical protein